MPCTIQVCANSRRPAFCWKWTQRSVLLLLLFWLCPFQLWPFEFRTFWLHHFQLWYSSTAGLLFSSWCPSGTILLTPFSMVWDWRVSRAGQCSFIGLSCSILTIVFYSFPLSLLSVYRLVLWGWGLQTDRVYITLSQPCTADLFK